MWWSLNPLSVHQSCNLCEEIMYMHYYICSDKDLQLLAKCVNRGVGNHLMK